MSSLVSEETVLLCGWGGEVQNLIFGANEAVKYQISTVKT